MCNRSHGMYSTCEPARTPEHRSGLQQGMDKVLYNAVSSRIKYPQYDPLPPPSMSGNFLSQFCGGSEQNEIIAKYANNGPHHV